MLEAVKHYLRVDGSEQDSLLSSFVSAAKTYLTGAGVAEVAEGADGYDLYLLAVCVHVSMSFYGDEKGGLERALVSIILQTKKYGGGEVEST